MAEKQQPWGKWFWGDWRKDARLRRCCYAARGLWADMLSLMGGECDRFGFLIMEGQALGASDLVGLLGGSEKEVTKLLAELDGKRVFSRTGTPELEDDLKQIIPAEIPAGVIFSRRMVRDKAKADTDKLNGGKGGNPRLKATDNGGVNPLDKAQNPEPEPKIEKSFNGFVVGRKIGAQSGTTIKDPGERLNRFQKTLAEALGRDGYSIVGAAVDPDNPLHARSLALCQAKALELGKGWPHQWLEATRA